MFRIVLASFALFISSSAFAQTSGLSCSTLEGNLHMAGDKCMAIATQPQRQTCFDAIGKSIADGYKQLCGSTIDKLKAEYTTKEKAKYPTQASSMNSNNGTPQNTGTPQNNASPNSGLSCSTLDGNLHIMGDKCLAVTAQQARQSCFDDIGKGIADGYKQLCGSTIDKLKAEYTAKEKAKYPTQASSMNSKNGSPQNNGSSTSGLSCSTLEGNLHMAGDKCLAVTAQQARQSCFDDIGKAIADGYKQICGSTIDKLKTEYTAKEKAKYPTQASSMNSNNGSPQNSGMTQNSPPKNVDCSKLIGDTNSAAGKCLAMTSQPSRKKCFDAVGDTISRNPSHDSCQGPLDALKRTVQDQEHSKYPNQPSGLDN